MWTELEQTTQAVTARDRMEVQGALEAALSPLLFPPKVQAAAGAMLRSCRESCPCMFLAHCLQSQLSCDNDQPDPWPSQCTYHAEPIGHAGPADPQETGTQSPTHLLTEVTYSLLRYTRFRAQRRPGRA